MSGHELTAFLALPAAEQRALSLFAVAHGALTRSDMVELLKLAGIRTAKARQFSTQDLGSLAETWSAGRWMVELPSEGSRSHRRVPPDIAHLILRHLRGTAALSELVRVVRARTPLLRRYSAYADVNLLAREVMLSAYGEPDPDLERALSYYRPSYGGHLGDLFVLALGIDAPMEAIKSLGFERAQPYVQRALELACHALVPVGEGVLAYLRATRDMLDPEITAVAVQYLTLRADPSSARALLSGLSHAALSAADCLIRLSEQDFSGAREQARRAVEQTRTKKSKKIKGLDGPLWPWVLLALLTDTEDA
jgi:hypothetical protein